MKFILAYIVKKLKIYLDTSVISHLFADDTPDKMEDTSRFWANIIDENMMYLFRLW